MKFVTINTTSYNKDSIIGVEMPTKDITEDGEPTGNWFYIVYVKDAIEEIVEFDNAEDCIKSRTELMTQLENNYYEEIQLETDDVYAVTGCQDTAQLLEGLTNLKEQFNLSDMYEIGMDTFEIPLIDQLYTRLTDCDKYKKTLVEVRNQLLHADNDDFCIGQVIDTIDEVDLDDPLE